METLWTGPWHGEAPSVDLSRVLREIDSRLGVRHHGPLLLSKLVRRKLLGRRWPLLKASRGASLPSLRHPLFCLAVPP